MTTYRGPGAPGTESGGRNVARIRARPDRLDRSTPETIADPRGPTPQHSGAGIQALAQVRENAIRGLDQIAAQAQAQRESAEASRKGVEREAALARARRYWQDREIELERESATTAGYRGHADRFRAQFASFRDEEMAKLGDVDDETRARIEVGYTNIETQFLGRAHKYEVERSYQQRDADLAGMRDDLIASSYTAPENYLIARGSFHAAVDESGADPRTARVMKERFDRDLLAGVLQRFTEPDGDAADLATAQSLLASGEAAAILGESTLSKWARRVEQRRVQLSAEAFVEGREFSLPPAREFRDAPPPGAAPRVDMSNRFNKNTPENKAHVTAQHRAAVAVSPDVERHGLRAAFRERFPDIPIEKFLVDDRLVIDSAFARPLQKALSYLKGQGVSLEFNTGSMVNVLTHRLEHGGARSDGASKRLATPHLVGRAADIKMQGVTPEMVRYIRDNFGLGVVTPSDYARRGAGYQHFDLSLVANGTQYQPFSGDAPPEPAVRAAPARAAAPAAAPSAPRPTPAEPSPGPQAPEDPLQSLYDRQARRRAGIRAGTVAVAEGADVDWSGLGVRPPPEGSIIEGPVQKIGDFYAYQFTKASGEAEIWVQKPGTARRRLRIGEDGPGHAWTKAELLITMLTRAWGGGDEPASPVDPDEDLPPDPAVREEADPGTDEVEIPVIIGRVPARRRVQLDAEGRPVGGAPAEPSGPAFPKGQRVRLHNVGDGSWQVSLDGLLVDEFDTQDAATAQAQRMARDLVGAPYTLEYRPFSELSQRATASGTADEKRTRLALLTARQKQYDFAYASAKQQIDRELAELRLGHASVEIPNLEQLRQEFGYDRGMEIFRGMRQAQRVGRITSRFREATPEQARAMVEDARRALREGETMQSLPQDIEHAELVMKAYDAYRLSYATDPVGLAVDSDDPTRRLLLAKWRENDATALASLWDHNDGAQSDIGVPESRRHAFDRETMATLAAQIGDPSAPIAQRSVMLQSLYGSLGRRRFDRFIAQAIGAKRPGSQQPLLDPQMEVISRYADQPHAMRLLMFGLDNTEERATQRMSPEVTFNDRKQAMARIYGDSGYTNVIMTGASPQVLDVIGGEIDLATRSAMWMSQDPNGDFFNDFDGAARFIFGELTRDIQIVDNPDTRVSAYIPRSIDYMEPGDEGAPGVLHENLEIDARLIEGAADLAMERMKETAERLGPTSWRPTFGIPDGEGGFFPYEMDEEGDRELMYNLFTSEGSGGGRARWVNNDDNSGLILTINVGGLRTVALNDEGEPLTLSFGEVALTDASDLRGRVDDARRRNRSFLEFFGSWGYETIFNSGPYPNWWSTVE